MIIISIDIGMQNMAYCLAQYNNKLSIIEWKTINLFTETETTNISPQSIITLFEEKLPQFFSADVILIENQPPNSKFKKIQDYLQMFFTVRGIKLIKLCHPNLKYRNVKSKQLKNTYKKRKKLSISLITTYLQKTKDNSNLDILNSCQKKDDLADALLQLLMYYKIDF
jgi:hypothetical protein